MNILNNIANVSYDFPTKSNHPQIFDYKDVEKWAKNSYPLTVQYDKMNKLIKSFIKHKRNYGSSIEKEFYKNIHPIDLINRLIKKRPLVFMGKGDRWVLKDGTAGFGKWTNIGKNNKLHSLKDYMSYDEIQLAVFISMSTSTPFINNGSRQNCGKVSDAHESEGIYIAQVGARFQERFLMEWKHMIVDPEQNTKENGYGKNNGGNKSLKMWSDFYEVDYFPLYTDIKGENERFKCIDGYRFMYLDTLVYKKRMKINALVFLQEANNRAKQFGKKAFCHVVGLGLGVWKISSLQTDLFIEAHLELLQEYEFPNIHTIYFSWMNYSKSLQNYSINIEFGKREPADPLNNTNLLLVANYAWDGNSYPGNEYWVGSLGSSGDPAAACCSMIPYLQNPDINPNISGGFTKYTRINGHTATAPTEP